MENASKALIIAGSILVSIVIISLGVMIVQNVSGLVKSQSDMSGQEVQSFNSKFEQYEGIVSGATARSLYTAVRSHNNQNANDPTLQVSLKIDGGDFAAGATQATSESAVTLPANTLKSGKTYNVTFATDPNSGRITAINIQGK